MGDRGNVGRRTLLCGGLAMAVMPRALHAADRPDRVLGLIYPGADTMPPKALDEARAMYPDGVRIVGTGLGAEAMTVAGFDSVIERVGPAAARLAGMGAQAVVLMGTSISFYNGAAFNRRLIDSIRQASALPATTMSSAMVDGLHAVHGHRVICATAYADEVNDRLAKFLTEEGFEVLGVKGLQITSLRPDSPVTRITPEQLLAFCGDVCAAAPLAQAMLVSSGSLRTLELLAPLEMRCRVPVVSSFPHALRAGVRLLGLDARVSGHGQLLAQA